jgi:drug/metabolite transporter (DMT)-like permease
LSRSVPSEPAGSGSLLRRFALAGSGRVRALAELALAVTGLIWGANFVLVKMALEDMPPLYYLGLRFLTAAVLLAPLGISRLRRLNRREWLVGCGIGVLLFIGFVLQTIGLRTTSPGISGFLTSLYVIMVPIILGLFLGRWPSPMVGVGVVVVVGGLALLSLYGTFTLNLGEILTLLATVFWALHILMIDYASNRISAIALVQLQMTVCAVLCLACAFIFEQPEVFPGWRNTGIVLWTGVMGGLVAYLLMAVGQRHTPPVLAGILMNLEAVFALIVSIIVGYDILTVRTVAGFVLVFFGTTIAHLGARKTPEMAAEPAPPGP